MKKALSLVIFFAVAAAASMSANAKEVIATITNVTPIYSDRVLNVSVFPVPSGLPERRYS